MLKLLYELNSRIIHRSNFSDQTNPNDNHDYFFFLKLKRSFESFQNNYNVRLDTNSNFETIMAGDDLYRKLMWSFDNKEVNNLFTAFEHVFDRT